MSKKSLHRKKNMENVIYIQEYQQQKLYIFFYICEHAFTVLVFDFKGFRNIFDSHKKFFYQTCHRFWSNSGFESDYTIAIDFLLGSSDAERFWSLPKIMKLATFQIKYGNVAQDRRKNHNWWMKGRTKTKEEKSADKKF